MKERISAAGIPNALVQSSVDYLNSDRAIQSIERDVYWPKWGSPWWHMSVLFEVGFAHLIPQKAAEKMVEEMQRTHLPFFFAHELPVSAESHHLLPCPCGLGNMISILSAAGVDVDARLPWARDWFLRYQMSDGGLNCDEDAYGGERDTSSIVGTIASLEAMLTRAGSLSETETAFLDRGAQNLIRRELRLGSKSVQNAEERADEADWLELCVPRFYFYDVLRGLKFLVRYAEILQRPIPERAIREVITSLETRFPDGEIIIGRESFAGTDTRLPWVAPPGERRAPASHFPLLDSVSRVGSVSETLTREWAEVRAAILRLRTGGLLPDERESLGI